MRTFKTYFSRKINDPCFEKEYACECHLCARTIRIFERLHQLGLSLEEISARLNVTLHALTILRDADYCDPELVVRLCHLLDEPTPEDCPRMKKSI